MTDARLEEIKKRWPPGTTFVDVDPKALSQALADLGYLLHLMERPGKREFSPLPVAELRSAARAFRVPANWLKAEAEAGRVPCLRAGARFLFNLETLRNALAQRITA